MRSPLMMATVAFLVFLVTSMLAQPQPLPQQVRQRDPTPFERPKYIVAVASTSNRETLTELKGLLAGRGYTLTSAEWDRGELSAIKKDSPSSNNSDRVLIWLERDPVKPAERAYIYFVYGRFEPFFGSSQGPERILTEADDARMTAIRDAIVAFALSRQ